jgi:hypothetical protein
MLDLKGQKFGRLLVLEYNGKNKSNCNMWLCKCDCGNIVSVSRHELRCGDTKSCGCIKSEVASRRFFKHGKRYYNEYHTWLSMKNRCINKNSVGYSNYGGRGISVCEKWVNSFEEFYNDMGPRPVGDYSIERINNDGNYEPSNCRWATSHEQSNNRRVTIFVEYNGIKLPLSDMCIMVGINYSCVQQRIKRYKWSIDRALSEPVGIAHNLKKNTPL